MRGFEVVDTDELGWTEWSDEEDGYVWREDRIAELLARDVDVPLYVSGTVSNQGRFYPQFDAIVLFERAADVLCWPDRSPGDEPLREDSRAARADPRAPRARSSRCCVQRARTRSTLRSRSTSWSRSSFGSVPRARFDIAHAWAHAFSRALEMDHRGRSRHPGASVGARCVARNVDEQGRAVHQRRPPARARSTRPGTASTSPAAWPRRSPWSRWLTADARERAPRRQLQSLWSHRRLPPSEEHRPADHADRTCAKRARSLAGRSEASCARPETALTLGAYHVVRVQRRYLRNVSRLVVSRVTVWTGR